MAGLVTAQLHPFRELRGDRHHAPSTPGDLLFHIRAAQPDLCFELASLILDRLGAVATVVDDRNFNTILDADGTQRQILRDNMAFGAVGAREFGTYFIGYASTPDVTEEMLRHMFLGNPPGNHDRILDFSTAVTGSLFFSSPPRTSSTTCRLCQTPCLDSWCYRIRYHGPMRAEGPSLEEVLEKAAMLQETVPGAVLVGGSAAAHHAGHRQSFDHDHVVADLAARFDAILENLEALGDWTLARAKPGKIILGELGGIETGVRQMLRQRPLEIEQVEVRGRSLTVPTEREILRVKAWLAVSRNQTRDYLDIAALADHMGVAAAAETLRPIDEYYADVNQRDEAVSSQVARQLADPQPRDSEVTRQLAEYKGLDPRWHDWEAVRAVLRRVSVEMAS